MFAVFENLQVFESRYEELNLKLYDPATAADRGALCPADERARGDSPIVETYRAWRQCGADLSGAKELLEEAADRELKEMAQQEIREKGTSLPPGGGAEAAAAAPGPQRRQERHCGNPRRRRRGGSRPVRRQPLPDVHHVRRAQGLEDGGCLRSTRPSWAASRRSASSSTGRGPTPG